MPVQKNVFFAHSYGVERDRLITLREEILAAMRPLLPADTEVIITLGMEDHERMFGVSGGWEGWIVSVAEGTTAGLLGVRPRYDAVVVTSQAVGKATAGIIDRCLRRGKPVWFYADGAFKPVREVVWVDPNDMRAGWMLGV